MTTPFAGTAASGAYQFKSAIANYPGTDTRVQRATSDRLNDIINVKDFGAKGDGVTDDTNALYNALICAYQLRSTPQDGATIFLPPGTYRLLHNQPYFISPVIALLSTTGGTAGTTTVVTFQFVPTGLTVGLTLVNSFFFPGGTTITHIAGNTVTFSNPAAQNFGVGTFISITVTTTGVQQGSIRLVGAGRDATIIRGLTDNGWTVWGTDTTGGNYINGMHNLTVWNESIVAGTGAFIDTSNLNNWVVCLNGVLPNDQKTVTFQDIGCHERTWFQTSRRTAKKAAKSASEIRRIPSIRWTGRAPDLIQRRTVLVETLSASATWVIVRKRGKAARAGAFLACIGHATPKRRSSDGTLINLRAPIFVHSISPLFILL